MSWLYDETTRAHYRTLQRTFTALDQFATMREHDRLDRVRAHMANALEEFREYVVEEARRRAEEE